MYSTLDGSNANLETRERDFIQNVKLEKYMSALHSTSCSSNSLLLVIGSCCNTKADDNAVIPLCMSQTESARYIHIPVNVDNHEDIFRTVLQYITNDGPTLPNIISFVIDNAVEPESIISLLNEFVQNIKFISFT